MKTAGILLVLCLVAAGSAAAQEQPAQRGEVSIEIMKVHFSDPGQAGFASLDHAYLSAVATVFGRYRLRQGLDVVAEFPFSHAGGDADGCVDAYCSEGVSSTVLNNPYLGVEWRTPYPRLSVSVGVRPPVQSASWLGGGGDWDDWWGGRATEMGVYGDGIDRLEAYLPDVTSVSTTLTLDADLANSLGIVGFTRYVAMHHPTAGGYIHDHDGEKLEHHLLYGADLRFAQPRWSLTVGVHARNYLSAQHLSDPVFYQAQVGGSWTLRSIRLYTELRRPFGNEYSRRVADRSIQVGAAFRVP